MNAQPLQSRRFIRKTQLAPGEYRKNFHQLDRDVIEVVSSAEADKITPLMSKIYLRLINAPVEFWEREGVLRFEGGVKKERQVGAWVALCELLGVASATASKALQWMHEQGIIGYFAGKNGVGIRIFINRAASSIGIRPGSGSKKILAFPPASSAESRASQNEVAFNDSYAVRENPDTDINPRAPKSGAPKLRAVEETFSAKSSDTYRTEIALITEQVVYEIAPHIKAACSIEHERTREWFQAHALPKAIRVSQAAAYDVLRSYGVINEPRSRSGKGSAHSGAEVGRQTIGEAELHRLSDEEVADYAQTCVALLVAQGQSIERTLSEMSVEAGGLLMAEDTERVRAQAEALLLESEATGKGR